jgi:hypothetical protein
MSILLIYLHSVSCMLRAPKAMYDGEITSPSDSGEDWGGKVVGGQANLRAVLDGSRGSRQNLERSPTSEGIPGRLSWHFLIRNQPTNESRPGST